MVKDRYIRNYPSIILKGNTMTDLEKICKYKNDLVHFKNILCDVKMAIRLAMDNDVKNQNHFNRVWELLEANGVKDCYDKGGSISFIKEGL